MYKIETIKVTKWFASIPAWIVSTANGVCITTFKIKSIMKAEICHDSILFFSKFYKHWELYWYSYTYLHMSNLIWSMY